MAREDFEDDDKSNDADEHMTSVHTRKLHRHSISRCEEANFTKELRSVESGYLLAGRSKG